MERDIWSTIEETRRLCRQSWETRARALMAIEGLKETREHLKKNLLETRCLLKLARQTQSREIIKK